MIFLQDQRQSHIQSCWSLHSLTLFYLSGESTA